jgi:flagellar capping protein FliD
MAVSMTEAMGKGVGLVNMIGGSSEKFVQKATAQKELAKTEIGDKIEVQESIASEMKSLQGLLVHIKKTADVLMNEDTSAFSQKKSSVRTNDVGKFDDYIKDVRVDSKAYNGDIRIEVEQVATRARYIIGGENNPGFHKTNTLGIDGNITLSLNGGANINVVVTGDQTLDQVLANIKGELVNNGNNTHEAFLVAGNNDTSCIEIRSKKIGAHNDIVFNFIDNNNYMNYLFDDCDGIQRISNIPGVDARVSIDGQERTQSSNEFIDARPGVSFTAIKKNNADQHNTIDVQEDNAKAKKMIIEFGNTLNELSHFIAKNDQTSRSHLDDKYADPYAELKSYNSKESPLRGNVVIEEAKLLWEKFTSKQTHKTGDITSIYDIGMGLKSETRKEDGVTFDSLVFEDEAKFEKLFAEKFDDVRALFITSAKITPQAGNIVLNVGEVQYVPTSSSKPIVSGLMNGNVGINVTYTDGAVNAKDFKIRLANGTEVDAKESKKHDNYYLVSFKDTALEGLTFAVYPKMAVDQTDNFTINYSAGLANIIRSDANSMFGEGGFSGLTIDASKDVTSKKERLEKELTRITKELDEMTKKLEGQFEQISMMDVMAGIQQAMIEKMFETS